MNRSINFADQALGEETQRYLAMKEKNPIHAVELDSNIFVRIIKSVDSSSKTIFFLGNSQTHSINQMKPGETNYIELFSDRVLENVICHSMPNGSLQEFLVLFCFWNEKLNISKLVIPVFMDDLREEGIRPFFIEFILSSGFKIVDSSEVSKKINLEIIKLNKADIDSSQTTQLYPTLQEKVEKKLDKILYERTVIWNQRENIRGTIFLKLYELRNVVFNINATTKRKMIPGRYSFNFAALEAILRISTEKEIQTYAYIPPIRNDVEVPYDIEEYEKFKNDVKSLADKHHAKFKNFENIVPGQFWGFKNSTNSLDKPELDFMHFQAAGHKILADSLYNFLNQ